MPLPVHRREVEPISNTSAAACAHRATFARLGRRRRRHPLSFHLTPRLVVIIKSLEVYRRLLELRGVGATAEAAACRTAWVIVVATEAGGVGVHVAHGIVDGQVGGQVERGVVR